MFEQVSVEALYAGVAALPGSTAAPPKITSATPFWCPGNPVCVGFTFAWHEPQPTPASTWAVCAPTAADEERPWASSGGAPVSLSSPPWQPVQTLAPPAIPGTSRLVPQAAR